MAAKLKKGDSVIVLAGKDKGKQGEIQKMLTAEGRAIVQGVNLVKKHTRPSQEGPGGIVEKEAAIQLSNLAFAEDGKATRVGFKKLDDGKKVRFSKKSGEVIDV